MADGQDIKNDFPSGEKDIFFVFFSTSLVYTAEKYFFLLKHNHDVDNEHYLLKVKRKAALAAS